MCKLYATKTCSAGTSWPLKVGTIGYPITLEWNYHFTLPTIPEDSRFQNVSNFSMSFHQENAKWWNIYICSVTWLQKMSTRVKSHDFPGQGIGPVLLTQTLCSRFRSFSSLKSTLHEVFIFWYHINKIHTQINQPAVMVKILSQPGIRLSKNIRPWIFLRTVVMLGRRHCAQRKEIA